MSAACRRKFPRHTACQASVGVSSGASPSISVLLMCRCKGRSARWLMLHLPLFSTSSKSICLCVLLFVYPEYVWEFPPGRVLCVANVQKTGCQPVVWPDTSVWVQDVDTAVRLGKEGPREGVLPPLSPREQLGNIK